MAPPGWTTVMEEPFGSQPDSDGTRVGALAMPEASERTATCMALLERVLVDEAVVAWSPTRMTAPLAALKARRIRAPTPSSGVCLCARPQAVERASKSTSEENHLARHHGAARSQRGQYRGTSHSPGPGRRR